ncbi:hypothetical protein AXFE_17870 [Acidithrix ferrooxidans]|uniref:Uncharacterized protein n=1 Tax=Acidithrix ferrooxidans TaxID=1280514 RepID=A0A0D8HHG8_9ACTN|nr:hypothetical protein AXFE_17870 [Acidithrix ferrooxidans]
MFGFTVELHQFTLEVRAHVGHYFFHALQVPGGENFMAELRGKYQVDVHEKDAVPASANVLIRCHKTKYS